LNKLRHPLVSVVCPTYNHEKYIVQALDSFLMQKTDFSFEIVVGEDYSTDSTRTICQKYAKKYPDLINLITSENNVGMHKNGLRVYNACKGKYIALCDGDDFWTDPLKLQKQVDFLEANPEYGYTFGKTKLYNDKKKEFIGVRGDKGSENYLNVLLGNVNIPTATVVFRRDLYKQCIHELDYLWKENLFYDYPLVLWFAKSSKIHFIDEEFSVYRILEESACHTNSKEKSLNGGITFLKVQMYFILNYPSFFKGEEILIYNQILSEVSRFLKINYYVGYDKQSKSRNYIIGKFIVSPFKLLKRLFIHKSMIKK